MIELSDRERNLLKILGIVIAVSSVYYLIIKPYSGLSQKVLEQQKTARMQTQQLESIYAQYKNIQNQQRRLDQLLSDSTGPTAFIEEQARAAGILENKSYSRETPGQVQGSVKKITTQIKFENVDITSLVNFIYSLEASDRLISVPYVRVTEAIKGSQRYDVIMKIDTFISR